MIARIRDFHRALSVGTALVAIVALAVGLVALSLAYSQQKHALSRIHTVVNANQKANDHKQELTNEKFCALLRVITPVNVPAPNSAYGKALRQAALSLEQQLGCGND